MKDDKCPRYKFCTYKDMDEYKCLHNGGGQCYAWYVNAGDE